jgi:hypothetical protein
VGKKKVWFKTDCFGGDKDKKEMIWQVKRAED